MNLRREVGMHVGFYVAHTAFVRHKVCSHFRVVALDWFFLGVSVQACKSKMRSRWIFCHFSLTVSLQNSMTTD